MSSATLHRQSDHSPRRVWSSVLAGLAKGLVATTLLTFVGLVSAESFRIESQENDGWHIDVQGSATLQRIANGVLISFDTLTVRARYLSSDPLYISSLQFSGTEMTGSGRTPLMSSERAPIGRWLAPGETLSLQVSTPIFMRYPDWQQKDPRYFLRVGVGNDGSDGTIPIETTLHELRLESKFRRGSKDVRDIGVASDRVYLVGFMTAVLAFFAIVYGFKKPTDEVIIGFLLFVFVWLGGIFPGLRFGYSMLWTRANAQVIDIDVHRDRSPKGGKSIHTPIVKYQYSHGAQQFSSTQVRLSTRWKSHSRDEAYAALHQWDRARLTGTPVPVWINPLDPSDAVLVRDLGWGEMFWCLVGLVYALWRSKILRR